MTHEAGEILDELASLWTELQRSDWSQPDLMIVSQEFALYWRASVKFGARVNRSNRHKFRKFMMLERWIMGQERLAQTEETQ